MKPGPCSRSCLVAVRMRRKVSGFHDPEEELILSSLCPCRVGETPAHAPLNDGLAGAARRSLRVLLPFRDTNNYHATKHLLALCPSPFGIVLNK